MLVSNYIEAFLPMIKGAILYTIPLSIISFICGIAIGVIVALIRINHSKNPLSNLAKTICQFYISIIRGTPLLVQLFIIFYGLPNIGIPAFPCRIRFRASLERLALRSISSVRLSVRPSFRQKLI